MSRDRKIYAVYENDQLVLKGDHNEVAALCQIKSRAIANYVRWNILVNGRYHIKNIEGEYRYVRKPKGMSEEQILDYLYRHLAEYGNTCLNDNPTPYIPRLQEILGRKITFRECEDVDDPWNYEVELSQTGRWKRGRINTYFVLEVQHDIS